MKNKRIISSILIVALAITYLFTPAHSLSGKIATVNSKKTVVSTMTFNGVKLKAYYGPYFSGYNSVNNDIVEIPQMFNNISDLNGMLK